jgi:hypothetical protein
MFYIGKKIYNSHILKISSDFRKKEKGHFIKDKLFYYIDGGGGGRKIENVKAKL